MKIKSAERIKLDGVIDYDEILAYDDLPSDGIDNPSFIPTRLVDLVYILAREAEHKLNRSEIIKDENGKIVYVDMETKIRQSLKSYFADKPEVLENFPEYKEPEQLAKLVNSLFLSAYRTALTSGNSRDSEQILINPDTCYNSVSGWNDRYSNMFLKRVGFTHTRDIGRYIATFSNLVSINYMIENGSFAQNLNKVFQNFYGLTASEESDMIDTLAAVLKLPSQFYKSLDKLKYIQILEQLITNNVKNILESRSMASTKLQKPETKSTEQYEISNGRFIEILKKYMADGIDKFKIKRSEVESFKRQLAEKIVFNSNCPDDPTIAATTEKLKILAERVNNITEANDTIYED